jgi:cytochrome c553
MKFHVVWGVALLAVFTTSPALAADSAAGKKVAAATCAVCHGIDGIAKNPEAPHLAGETAAYLVKQLKAFKSGDRKHEQMSIIAEGLSDEDMANVAAWYSKIKITVEMPQ